MKITVGETGVQSLAGTTGRMVFPKAKAQDTALAVRPVDKTGINRENIPGCIGTKAGAFGKPAAGKADKDSGAHWRLKPKEAFAPMEGGG